MTKRTVICAEVRKPGSKCGPLPSNGFIIDYDSISMTSHYCGCMGPFHDNESETKARFENYMRARYHATVEWCDINAAWIRKYGA